MFYCANKDDIIKTITSLIEEPNILFEDLQAVWSALNEYSQTPLSPQKSFDFPDALIADKARRVIEKWDTEYEGNYTFDQAALHLQGNKSL